MSATPTYGSSVVRASRPDPEYIDITAYGDTGPVYIEKWRGWVIESWCFWGREE